MKISLDNLYGINEHSYRINWEITSNCNFKCEYCSNYKIVNKTNNIKTYSPKELSHFFDLTGVSWLIMFNGGEPFLYPNFVEVCSELSRKHFLQLNTNLSNAKVHEFADKIYPEKVLNINASYHRNEILRYRLQEDFLQKCLYLLNKGFKVMVSMVAYPEYIHLISEDIEMFGNNGIETVLFGYRGVYGGKQYPFAYDQNELEIIKKHSIADIEIKIAKKQMNYYGYYCDAGRLYFIMKQNGDLGRCSALPKKIGNLFDLDFPPFGKRRHPCIAEQCRTFYNGPLSVTSNRANLFKIWFEKRKDSSHF